MCRVILYDCQNLIRIDIEALKILSIGRNLIKNLTGLVSNMIVNMIGILHHCMMCGH